MNHLFSTLGVVMFLTGAPVVSGCCAEKSPAEAKRDEATARDFVKRLGAAHAAVAAAPGERACTGNATRQVRDLETVDLDYLRWLQVGAGAPPSLGEFDYLRTSVLAGIKPSARDWNDNSNRVGELKRGEYLGVWRVQAKKAPVLMGGTNFAGGFVDATLVIVEIASMKPVCSAQVKAESSKDVKTKRGGRGLVGKLLEKDPAKAIVEDLKENLEQAGDAAMKRVSAQWKIRF